MALARRHPRWLTAFTAVTCLLLLWAVQLLQVSRGVERARDFWAQPQGEPGGLLYVALGDSAAQGVGASHPDRGYVGLLAERLRQDTGRPVQVLNLSVSGARIDDVLADQLPRLRGLSPDLVTVAVGGNDIRRFDDATFAARAAELTAALPGGAVVADVPYFMHGRWQEDAESAAATVTRLAQADGLVVAPLHEALRAQGWTAMLTQFSADWFHPNDRGHRVWADTFWRAIEEAGLLAELAEQRQAGR